jgi:hypothetical protein
MEASVPAKTTTWRGEPFTTELQRRNGQGCANPRRTRRGGGGEYTDGGDRGGVRPYLRSCRCGEERERRRRGGCARTLATFRSVRKKPTDGRFSGTVGGSLLFEALRGKAAREAGRLVTASASSGQKPPRSWTKQGPWYAGARRSTAAGGLQPGTRPRHLGSSLGSLPDGQGPAQSGPALDSWRLEQWSAAALRRC